MNTTIYAAKAAAAILLAITLGACATELGRNFDDAYASDIRLGQTTKADVRAKLGRPAVVLKGSEDDVWIYAYYQGGGFGAVMKDWFGQADPNNPRGAQQKRLEITFKGDIVKESRFKQELPPPDPLEEAYR
jgi:outer membrane protein assembly factor BamE (lipoprotein component of BamABCDE complex)